MYIQNQSRLSMKNSLLKSEERTIENDTDEEENEEESDARIDIDEEHRCIYVYGEIDHNTSLGITLALDMLNKESDEEITIVINSGGGSAHDMFAIVDRMLLSKSPIKTIGTGIVASAATLVMAAGTPGRRFLTKHCMVMTHELHWGSFASLQAVKDVLHTGYRMQEKYIKLMSKFGGHTPEEIKEYLVGKDYWMDAAEAIKKVGIADKIATQRDL